MNATDSSSAQSEAIRRSLPRGRHAASREVVADSQRTRMIEAMTNVASEKGYLKTTVVDVVREAGVGKPTFYDHFADKQACLIAAYDVAIAGIMGAAAAALSADAPPAERIEHGVAALVEFAASHEAETRIALIEIIGGGPKAVEHMKATHSALADTYVAMREEARKRYPEYPSLTRVQGLAVVGAVTEPVRSVLVTEGPDAVRELKSQLVSIVEALSLLS